MITFLNFLTCLNNLITSFPDTSLVVNYLAKEVLKNRNHTTLNKTYQKFSHWYLNARDSLSRLLNKYSNVKTQQSGSSPRSSILQNQSLYPHIDSKQAGIYACSTILVDEEKPFHLIVGVPVAGAFTFCVFSQ